MRKKPAAIRRKKNVAKTPPTLSCPAGGSNHIEMDAAVRSRLKAIAIQRMMRRSLRIM
ncbi:hypothetical protein [Schaalia cardiffensis]|uniref:hypothetical protein n=1 Tax=Schaalia cardiffensis TaxID=181487 RepID=UPI002AAF62AE|nr:hypothetical protein [Schaalia cardiffensis]